MGTAVRPGSVYYLDPAQVKMQEAVGGIKCVPFEGYPAHSRKSVYRVAPSSLQPGHVLQPVSGMTLPDGLQCDSCLPQRLLQQLSSEDARYATAVGANEPQILRLVPQGKNVYLEEVKPSSQLRRSKSARQKMPNVVEVVEDHDWYDKVAVAETSESDAPLEPDTCPECLDELMRRKRTPYREPAYVKSAYVPEAGLRDSPVYVKKVPASKRLCSRRSPSPQRTLSRGPSPSSPRCATCTACKSCGTVQSDSKPVTSRSRSRKWYE
ncbi:hypothetical protein MTO96_009386 [Rhipicephalus appendiculatus]